MKYFIVAGEPSGDLHGSALISAIKNKDKDAEIRAWGGDGMQAAGATILKHCRELSIFGLWEVITHIGEIRNNLKQCKSDIQTYRPDVVIFIDYPGFNLRILKWAKTQGYRTAYYVLPHIWIWKENRIDILKSYCDEVFVILPFEKPFCEERGLNVHYVGHPLVERMRSYFSKEESDAPALSPSHIALFPGSRMLEVKRILPIMLEVATMFPEENFLILVSSNIPADFYASSLKKKNLRNVSCHVGSSWEILKNAKAAIVKSGTSTLETALMGVPEMAVYRTSDFSYYIWKIALRMKFVSLPNLLSNKEVIKELLQNECNPRRISQELNRLLEDTAYTDKMKKEFDKIRLSLETGIPTSRMIADIIVDRMLKK